MADLQHHLSEDSQSTEALMKTTSVGNHVNAMECGDLLIRAVRHGRCGLGK